MALNPLAFTTFYKAFRMCAWEKRRLVLSQNFHPGREGLGDRGEA